MIEIKDLGIKVWDKEILREINLTFEKGKNYLILWKNWSWKSSLSNFLVWNPVYEKISWETLIEWKNIEEMSVTGRSLNWLFLSFQNIPEIAWLNLSDFLRTIYNNKLKVISPDTRELTPFVFKRFIKKFLDELNIPETFLQRDLNVWFSGWEKRKIEMLQAKLLNPKYLIFDEIDSWLDLDAFKIVANNISQLNNDDNSIIVITHHFKIVDYLKFDKVYVLKNWMLEKEGGTELIKEIMEKGFE